MWLHLAHVPHDQEAISLRLRLENCYCCKRVYITKSAPLIATLWVCTTRWRSSPPARPWPSAGDASPLKGSSTRRGTSSAPSFLYSSSLSNMRGVSPSETFRLRTSWYLQDFLSFRNLLVKVILLSLYFSSSSMIIQIIHWSYHIIFTNIVAVSFSYSKVWNNDHCVTPIKWTCAHGRAYKSEAPGGQLTRFQHSKVVVARAIYPNQRL